MRKLSMAFVFLALAGGIGGGLAVAQHKLTTQTLDASTISGSTTANLSLARKGLDWDCQHVTSANPCYYTWSTVTNSYSVPSAERGPIVFDN